MVELSSEYPESEVCAVERDAWMDERESVSAADAWP